MTVLTSDTTPIRIDQVTVSGGGRLGMTFCPGKKDAHAASGAWDRELDTDLAAIRDWGASLLVTLVEPHELDVLEVPGLGRRVVEFGMDWLHLPIVDVSVPSREFENAWPGHGGDMASRLARGEGIVLHCRGGLGRTGLVAARLLVEFGYDPAAAIADVRAARPGAIETAAQERYVLACRPMGAPFPRF
ncbi:MAG: phosphatase [Proteobacteria bacterium]|nr:MAG: phosphatase [Pseudomonadota bacterium]